MIRLPDPNQAAIQTRVQTLGTKQPEPPIDVERIARTLGIQYSYQPLKNHASGFILKREGQPPVIRIEETDSKRRQRFTFAHELGHYWLHRDDSGDYGYVEYRGELSTLGTDPAERWANRYAAELLMPASYVLAAWARGDSIQQIQDTLEVSDAALGHRLVNLGLMRL